MMNKLSHKFPSALTQILKDRHIIMVIFNNI